MSYLVLARKYRPQNFEQVIGQGHVTQTLIHAIEAGRLAHAILFSGPRGTGKTTVARILAKAMNCEKGPSGTPCNQCRSCREITAGNASDVFEIDGASNNSVEQVRELRENLRYMPTYSSYKIYIIDEVHMLSLAAFNALLKTLEEPPAHILFMFATTEAHKIPITILSRCQRHDLRRIETGEIVGHLASLCKKEHVSVDSESLALIAQEAGGSMRDALSLMDHVFACAQGPVTVKLICDLLGIVDREHLFNLSEAVFARDISRVLKNIDEVWRFGFEMKRFYSDLVIHFHHLTFAKMGADALETLDLPNHESERMQAQIADVDPVTLMHLFDLLFQAEATVKLSSQPRFALEMVFLKLFQTPPSTSIDTLIDRLDSLREGIVVRNAPPESGAVNSAPTLDSPDAGKPEKGGHPASPPDIAQADGESDPDPVGPPGVPMEKGALWEQVIQRIIKQKPSLAALLKNCNFSGETEDQFNLEVFGNDFSLKSITKQHGMLERLCCEISGRSVKLNIVANIEDMATKQKKKKKVVEQEQKALDHPMVMEAIKLFDGKVIDVTIRQEV